ncbi:AAA family ATPase [Rhodospirillum sp. A1_3_36]|uniref:AAA family ATPase n=1 Tax=Rhodospirillum sp. A1_3_36 TaxID=3391666 RepID=UPI0039A490E3
MKLERLRVKNFKSLRDVSMEEIPPFCVVVGQNGVGKTTLFEVFGFLRDSLASDVRSAFMRRGGFHEVVSRGSEGETIFLELAFRMELSGKDRLVTYSVELGVEGRRPHIVREILKYKRAAHGRPYHFLDFTRGKGYAISNEEDFDKSDEHLDREDQALDDNELAIKGLGVFRKFKAANAVRSLIEGWHLSDFHITAAREVKDAGVAESLSVDGDNLALVTQYMFEQHPDLFIRLLDKMRRRVPGVDGVEAHQMDDGRVSLRFSDGTFNTPFIGRFVSDGTIKMFAYLVLLHDPAPHPLLCVEEPENQLYPTLLGELAEEFEEYAERGGQVFVSTHSPDFLNAVPLESIWVMEKRDGFTEVARASEDAILESLVREGDLPGYLWRQGLFGGLGRQ